MSKLNSEQKIFVVTRLARYETPTEVAKAFKEQYGEDVARNVIAYYDPTSGQGSRELAADLRELFEVTRKAYVTDIAVIPIAQQAFRVNELMRLYQRYRSGNPRLAASFLEQAAKETGGVYTNRRDVTTNGESLNGPKTVEEKRERLKELADQKGLRLVVNG